MMAAISFAAVARMLGIAHRPRPWQQRHLRFLVAAHGFPSPLPAQGSRPPASALNWDPRAVDQWFADRAGEAACRSAETAAIEAAAAALDQRAAQLFAGKEHHAG